MNGDKKLLNIVKHIYLSCWAGFVLFLLAGLLEFFLVFGLKKNMYHLLRVVTGYAIFGLAAGIIAGLITSLFTLMSKRHPENRRIFFYYVSLFIAVVFMIYAGYYTHLVLLANIPYYATKSIMYTGGIIIVTFAVFFVVFSLFVKLHHLPAYQRTYTNRTYKWHPFLLGFLVATTIGLYCLNSVYAKQAGTVGNSGFSINEKPNIVLVVVDALRWDHMSCYGYGRDTSPNIDQIAQEGIIFNNAYAQSNDTLVSIPTLFLSFYPVSHNVLSEASALPPQCSTLAEDMKAAGYKTAGFSSNPRLWGGFGFQQGFDCFYTGQNSLVCGLYYTVIGEILDRMFIPTDEKLTAQALSWITSNRSERFFAYLHYMATHAPYPVPERYENIYVKEKIQNRIDFPCSTIEVSAAQKRDLINRYDNAIKFIDDEIDRLLTALEALGLKEDTLLIITADHGEAFGEHGAWTHGEILYQETIRVPLIMRYPKIIRGQMASNELVGLIDIKPTILNITGIVQNKNYHGKDLSPLFTIGNNGIDRGELFGEDSKGLRCIVTPKWKLISHKNGEMVELYNLEEDPEEKNNMVKVYPEVAGRLQGHLEAKLKEYKEQVLTAAEANVSVQIRRKLKSLGYAQ